MKFRFGKYQNSGNGLGSQPILQFVRNRNYRTITPAPSPLATPNTIPTTVTTTIIPTTDTTPLTSTVPATTKKRRRLTTKTSTTTVEEVADDESTFDGTTSTAGPARTSMRINMVQSEGAISPASSPPQRMKMMRMGTQECPNQVTLSREEFTKLAAAGIFFNLPPGTCVNITDSRWIWWSRKTNRQKRNTLAYTLLSRDVRSLFGPTRKSSPWDNSSDCGLNQSIKRRLSL